MKKTLLTVGMLLSAAGIKAAAGVDYVLKLRSKGGESLGLFSQVSGVYWKGNPAGNPEELWGIGGELISENNIVAAEIKKCEILNRKNNFVSPETEFVFPKGTPIRAYNFRCLATLVAKHPGQLQYIQQYGEHKGSKIPFNDAVFQINTWPKF